MSAPTRRVTMTQLFRDELATARGEIAMLRDEIVRLEPVVRAALAWRDDFAVAAFLGGKTRSQQLCDAIDALPEDLKARLRAPEVAG